MVLLLRRGEQIFTELWTEPKTGRVPDSITTDLEFIKGLSTEELLLSLLVQDLSSSYSWYPFRKPFADCPNDMMFEQLFSSCPEPVTGRWRSTPWTTGPIGKLG